MSTKVKEKVELKYLKSLIIVFGKSGFKICQYIQQNLRLKIKVLDSTDENIMGILNNFTHNTFEKFISTYMVSIDEESKVQKINNFKIFIVADLDKFNNEEDKQNFIDKSMFKEHWAYEYIVPIYNDKNLKDTLLESNIPYQIKFEGNKKKEYIRIFPLKDKFEMNISDRNEVEFIKKLLRDNKKTNLNILLDYCLNI